MFMNRVDIVLICLLEYNRLYRLSSLLDLWIYYSCVSYKVVFQNVLVWLEECEKHNLTNRVPRILVGNKCDCTDSKAVNTNLAQRVADAHNMPVSSYLWLYFQNYGYHFNPTCLFDFQAKIVIALIKKLLATNKTFVKQLKQLYN